MLGQAETVLTQQRRRKYDRSVWVTHCQDYCGVLITGVWLRWHNAGKKTGLAQMHNVVAGA